MSFAVETIGCSFHGMVPRPKQTLDGASDYPPSRQSGRSAGDWRDVRISATENGGQWRARSVVRSSSAGRCAHARSCAANSLWSAHPGRCGCEHAHGVWRGRPDV